MLWALNSHKKPVLIRDAESVSDHVFFCPNCYAELSIIVPETRAAHFRHHKNEACEFRGGVMSERDFCRIFPDHEESKPTLVKIWCERAQSFLWMMHTLHTFTMMRSRYRRQCFPDSCRRDFSLLNGQPLYECKPFIVGR